MGNIHANNVKIMEKLSFLMKISTLKYLSLVSSMSNVLRRGLQFNLIRNFNINYKLGILIAHHIAVKFKTKNSWFI